MTYEDDLQFCVQLVTALQYIVRVCQEHDIDYPDLKADIKGLIEGVNVRLPSGEMVTHPDGSPLHGLLEQIEHLIEVADLLELETELGVTERQALADTDELRLPEGGGDEEEGQSQEEAQEND